jgi:hypothetical protein
MWRACSILRIDVIVTPRQCLLKILFANREAAAVAAQALSSSQGWPTIFKLADAWNVVPQLAERIQELGFQPPADAWLDFKRVLFTCYAKSSARASKGASALRHLTDAGIPALAFKGLASMARLYARPAHRTIADVDLLVPPERLKDAVDRLGAIGFVSPEGHELARWERFVENAPGFSGNKAISLVEPGGTEVDLHWSVGGLDPEGLEQRAEGVTVFAIPIRIVGAADAMVLTARHAIRENLAVDVICRDLFDIRLSCGWLAARGLLAPVLEEIARLHPLIPVLALTQILDSLDGANQDVNAAARILAGIATPEQIRSAHELEALFFYQVRNGPFGKDLLYLAHSRPMRQILTGAFANWREYRRFMSSLEEKDGEAVPLGRRAWHLAAAVKNAGPARWSSLRTLARLKFDSTL